MTTEMFAGRNSLVWMEYTKGNHELARNPTLVAEKVKHYLIKCMDYRQITTVIIPINVTITSHCRDKAQIIQSSTIYSFIHTFV